MGIEQNNIFKVVDSTWEYIESEFERLSQTIIPRVQVLIDKTGVGATDRSGKGIPWKDLKDAAFDLIDKGVVNIDYENGIPVVKFENLESIDLHLGVEALKELKSFI